MKYPKRHIMLFIVIFSLIILSLLNIYIDVLGVQYLFAKEPLYQKEPIRQFLTFIAAPILFLLVGMLFAIWIYKQTQYSLTEKVALVVTMIFAFFLAITSIWQLVFFPLFKGGFGGIDFEAYDQPFSTPWFVPNVQLKIAIATNGIVAGLFITLMYDVFVERRASPITNMIRAIVYYATTIFITFAFASFYTGIDFGEPISNVYRWIGIIGLIGNLLILVLLIPYVETHTQLFRRKQHVPGVIDIV